VSTADEVRCGREPTPGDAIAGVAPRSVFEPGSREECRAVFHAARADRLALAVVGGGTELGLGGRPARLDAVVSSRRLDRVLEYAPSDQVVVVEAGIPLAALQAVLAGRGQRLACDPPRADRATVGGLLATNAFGPLRARHGSLRDLLIGVSILRADATVARGGGKVVKNVAGFDLPKLMVGALGTLGMIETATFRLHPVPEVSVTLRIDRMSARAVRSLVVAMRDEQVEPAAVVALGHPGHHGAFDVLVRFEGFDAGVAEQRDRTASLLREAGQSAGALSTEQARDAWREHDALRTRGNARVKVSALAAALEATASTVVPAVVEVLSNPATILYPTLGLVFLTGDAGDRVAFAAGIARARAHLGAAPGSLVVQELPAAARDAVDVWGPPPAAFALMKGVKARFDPENRLNPGRFVGGL
jgi:glycolate oxidase FAD binding subunit